MTLINGLTLQASFSGGRGIFNPICKWGYLDTQGNRSYEPGYLTFILRKCNTIIQLTVLDNYYYVTAITASFIIHFAESEQVQVVI